ncbi:MAG: radical SAM protein [Candidatus Hodarchaeota archaeon]
MIETSLNRGFSLPLALNFLWKRLAHFLVDKCEVCREERLFSILDVYSKKKSVQHSRCSILASFIKPLISSFFSRMSIKKRTVRQLIEDPLLRKCILGVVKGIAQFGIRQPQPTSVPVTIVWNFTNKCNLNCLHCHQDSSPTSSYPELTTSQAFKVVDNMANAGVAILTFSGGEPLLRSDIYEVIRRAKKNGMLCTIASNGILMTREVAKKLLKTGIERVEIGLDGFKSETHEFLRNASGCFEAAVQGIRHCSEVGFEEIAATMTLYKRNFGEIEETIDLAEKIGATRFYLNRLIAAGRGIKSQHLDVTPREKVKALKILYERFCQSLRNGSGIQCYARGMPYYSRLSYERSKGRLFTVSEAFSGHEWMFRKKFGNEIAKIVNRFARGFGGCSAGSTYAGLTASGDLIPCVPANIKLGNLLDQDLEEIWMHNKLLKYIRERKRLWGSCGECKYNGLCGGCRYTALISKKDWLGPDVSCPFANESHT